MVFAADGLEQVAAESNVDPGTCRATSTNGVSFFWIWLVLFLMISSWIIFGTAAYYFWKELHKDLHNCWDQVGDEDAYIATQANRIDAMEQRQTALGNHLQQLEATLGDKVEEVSNEVSMTHDYASGIHYSLVEHGGFLRNGLGLSHDQWVHLNVLERGNLIASRTAGSVELMRLVRQRFTPIGPSDDTDM